MFVNNLARIFYLFYKVDIKSKTEHNQDNACCAHFAITICTDSELKHVKEQRLEVRETYELLVLNEVAISLVKIF